MDDVNRYEQSELERGTIADNGRGILLHSDYVISERGVQTNSGTHWPNELRQCLLYWDRIISPVNDSIWVEVDPVANNYLIGEGILEKPCLSADIFAGNNSSLSEGLVDYFLSLDRIEPGAWCMGESASAAISQSNRIVQDRGRLIQLYNAIPFPAVDCPLEDIVRFRRARKDEILALSFEMDRLYQNILRAGDVEWEQKRAVREVGKRCQDVINASRESKLRLRMGSVSLSVSTPLTATVGYLARSVFGMPELGAFLGGVAPSVSIDLGAALKGREPRADHLPYRFVARLNNTPFYSSKSS